MSANRMIQPWGTGVIAINLTDQLYKVGRFPNQRRRTRSHTSLHSVAVSTVSVPFTLPRRTVQVVAQTAPRGVASSVARPRAASLVGVASSVARPRAASLVGVARPRAASRAASHPF